jgi:ABC-2 type transport system ATP-binding protein
VLSERIFAHRLCKHFDDFVAVDGVSLQVMAGEVLVLLGPNGAGKTTTVRMLTSILSPTSGEARIAGYDVVKQADMVRASVGVLTEQHGLYGRMNAHEYLQFFGELYGLRPAVCKPRIQELLNRFGLEQWGRKRLGEYSKGMRQKLALVRALLHDPPVMLLDEPTSAMDPESARMVREAIQELRTDERAVILCTHNLAEAEQLADQVAIIRRGRIILQGTLADLKAALLEAAEYQVTCSTPVEIDFQGLDAFPGVRLLERAKNGLRFQVCEPETTNPKLLRWLLDHSCEVVAFQEIPRTLEEVYIQAVHATSESSSRVA